MKTGPFRTTAYLSTSTVTRVDGGDDAIYSPECNSGDYFAAVDWSNHVGRSSLDRLKPERNHIIKITFVGHFELSNSGLFGTLDGWARAQVSVSKVKTFQNLTNRRGVVRQNGNAPRPEVAKIEDFRSNFWSFLSFLLNPGVTQYRPYLADDFVFTDQTKRNLTRNEFYLRNMPYIDGPRESTISTSYRVIRSSGNEIVGLGTIELAGTKERTKFISDVVFRPVDGRWTITTGSIRRSAD